MGPKAITAEAVKTDLGNAAALLRALGAAVPELAEADLPAVVEFCEQTARSPVHQAMLTRSLGGK